jgi:hypothetical protein
MVLIVALIIDVTLHFLMENSKKVFSETTTRILNIVDRKIRQFGAPKYIKSTTCSTSLILVKNILEHIDIRFGFSQSQMMITY